MRLVEMEIALQFTNSSLEESKLEMEVEWLLLLLAIHIDFMQLHRFSEIPKELLKMEYFGLSFPG